jgi:hypothetical protein
MGDTRALNTVIQRDWVEGGTIQDGFYVGVPN